MKISVKGSDKEYTQQPMCFKGFTADDILKFFSQQQKYFPSVFFLDRKSVV